MWQINKWLQSLYHNQGFSYIDHGTCFEKPGVRWGPSVRGGKDYLLLQACQAGEERFKLKLPGEENNDVPVLAVALQR